MPRSIFISRYWVLGLALISASAVHAADRNPFHPTKPPAPVKPAVPAGGVPNVPAAPLAPPPPPPKTEAEKQRELLSKLTYLGTINGKEFYKDEAGKCHLFRENDKLDDTPCYRALVDRLQQPAHQNPVPFTR